MEVDATAAALGSQAPYSPRGAASGNDTAAAVIVDTEALAMLESEEAAEASKRQKTEPDDDDADDTSEDEKPMVWNPITREYVPKAVVGSATDAEDWRD